MSYSNLASGRRVKEPFHPLFSARGCCSPCTVEVISERMDDIFCRGLTFSAES
jgi:hypothetical protein